MSAPLPAWSSTIPMMAKHMMTCRTVSAMTTLLPPRSGPHPRRLLHDTDELRRLEAGAPDEPAVDVRLRQQRLCVVGLDAATIENGYGLGDLLRRQLGEESPQIPMDLRGLRRRGVDARADGPHRLVGEHTPGDHLWPEAGQPGPELPFHRGEREA